MVGKRKREGAEGEAVGAHVASSQSKELHTWMKDTLGILRKQDTMPSIFDRPLTSAEPEPSNKRSKPVEPTTILSIAKSVENEVYTAIEELVSDVDRATDELLEELQHKVKDGTLTTKETEQQTLRASSLKEHLDRLVIVEMMQRPRRLQFKVSANKQTRHATEEKGSVAHVDGKTRTILTLSGGEKNAKQLFSSLAKREAPNATLDEQALPNGITTTGVLPVHSLEEENENSPTIGSTFAPPQSIRPLNPPKQGSKHISTRSSSINWHNPTETTTTSKDTSSRENYNKQPLPTCQWLTYNVVPSSEQLTSPSSKRRHRDRALSTGEPQSAITEENSAAHAQAKEDALFRSVYSSFAPDHDDFGAVVTEGQKNRIWWTRYGERQYQDLLDMKDEELHGMSERDGGYPSGILEIDETLVEEAISNWNTQDVALDMKRDGKLSQRTQEADDLLQEISELLEILDSHQRVRNLSQPTISRALQGQKEQLASMPGDPSSPSIAEIEVYENLKCRLVEVIAALPPYMLAKLDGDRLGALQLSTKIKIPGRNQKGTLEEDDFSIKAKAAVKPAVPAGTYPAYGGSSALRSGYPSTPPVQQYAQRPGYGQPTAQRQPSMSSSYTAQFSGRTPSATQYPASSVRTSYGAQYPLQRTNSSSYTDRYANGATPQYSHHQPPRSYGQYPNSYLPPAAQTANSYGPQYPTQPPRIPPASTPAAQAYRGSQSEFQQRTLPPPAYNYGSTQAGAVTSPNNSHGSSFSGQAGTAPQHRPAQYHQHSSHYGSRSPAEPQTNGSIINGQGRMSPDEQTTLMNSQKAQLVEQQQTRQASGTPQPTTSQSSQQNGTSAPQPNGVLV
ncbi:MAG: hypothetical protein Q9163_000102 [Psora crenata]